MTCNQIEKKLPDFLSRNMDEREKSEFESHLNACISCKEEVEKFSTLWGDLGRLPQEQPSEAIRTRFYTALDAYEKGLAGTQQGPKFSEVFNQWLVGWWPSQPVIQMGFSVALLLVGLFLGNRLSQPTNGETELSQLRSEVKNMRELVTLSLLQQQSPTERLRGVSYSQRLQQPDQEVVNALLHTLDYDQNVNVRLAAVDALSHFVDDSTLAQKLSRSLLQQDSPLVQIALIDQLIIIEGYQSTETLKKLLDDDLINPTVKQRAEWGIEQLY